MEHQPRREEMGKRKMLYPDDPKVRDAIERNDKRALRAMGREGGRVAADNNAIRKEVAAIDRVRAAETLSEHEKRDMEANRHVVPFDPEEGDAQNPL